MPNNFFHSPGVQDYVARKKAVVIVPERASVRVKNVLIPAVLVIVIGFEMILAYAGAWDGFSPKPSPPAYSGGAGWTFRCGEVATLQFTVPGTWAALSHSTLRMCQGAVCLPLQFSPTWADHGMLVSVQDAPGTSRPVNGTFLRNAAGVYSVRATWLQAGKTATPQQEQYSVDLITSTGTTPLLSRTVTYQSYQYDKNTSCMHADVDVR